MTITRGFYLTTHALERLYERHLYIFADPLQEGKARWDSGYRALSDSTEDKSFKNNTEFMVYIYEKYGFEKDYKFFINGDVLFVGIVENGKKLIVTTMACSWYSMRHLRNAALPREAKFGANQTPFKYRKFGLHS